MNKRLILTVTMTAMTALAFACGPLGGNKNQEGDQHPFPDLTHSGCLQGVMVNAQNGERIPINSDVKEDGIFAIVRGEFIKASPVSTKNELLKGEFTLCGVPVDEAYPLVVHYTGFADFETAFDIPSTVPAKTNTGEYDVRARKPTRVANIKLYPLNAITSDYSIGVVHNGAPVVGAVVTLKPSGTGIGIAGPYLTPIGAARHKPLTATTNDQGQAVFPKDQLVWGSSYGYTVIPPNNADLRTERGTVFVGMGLDGLNNDPFRHDVVLESAQTTLVVVSASTSLNDYVPDGAVSYTFNRDIELVPATADGITASVTDAVTATLAVNTPGNDKTEQASVTITGKTLKLAPVWKKAPSKDKEPAIRLSYAGISVRPATGAKRLQTVALAPTVVLYGGVVVKTPTTITAVGDTDIIGPAGDDVGPMTVEVRDQDGAALVGATVTFAVTAGGGSVDDLEVQTDAQGRASTTWTFGNTGAQTMTAGIDALEVEFTGTIADVNVTGNNQRALVGTSLINDPVLTVTDENSDPLPNANVTLTASNANDTLTVGAETGPTIEVQTDGAGQITLDWELSTTVGTHTVTVSGGTTMATITAVAQQPTAITRVSGNNQTQNTSLALTAPIVPQLNDQDGIGIVGATLQITTANTGSTLVLGASGPAATVTGTTDANGRVSATWTMGTAAATMHTATVTVIGFAGVTNFFTATTN